MMDYLAKTSLCAMRPVFIPDPPNLAHIIFFDYRLYSDKDVY